jgi:hypothetical protein
VVLKRVRGDEHDAAGGLRAALEREGRLIATFSPYRQARPSAASGVPAPFLHNTDSPWHPALERPGPIIDIWAVQ